MRNTILKISATVLGLLGLLTLFMGGSIIFDLFGIREKEGNYVLFIVYANFICAFLYLFASYCFFMNKKWSTIALFIAVGILIIAYIGLLIHIESGGIYEMRTVKAMLFRTSLTIVFAAISWYFLTRTQLVKSPDPANKK